MDSTIRYYENKAIDKERWNRLIESAANGLAYAHTDMLDAMSPGWDALVFGDYEAVMPLTWRKKMGIRYLCQPAFCQQLGIFSNASVTPSLAHSFMQNAATRFRLIEIFLNQPPPSLTSPTQATNYLLSLHPNYETINEHYSKDLLKNLRRASRYNLKYMESSRVVEAMDHYRNLYGEIMNLREEDYGMLTGLCKKWMPEGKCIVREVQMEGKSGAQLLAIGIFLKDNHRLYNIACGTLPNGRTLEANHYLYDQLIREFAGTSLTLDFAGSDLPGVARFLQKFNPIAQPYFFWKSNRLPAVLRWWKQ